MDSNVYLCGFDIICNVCYILKGSNKLSTLYVAIKDDSEDKQVNFISILARYVHTQVNLYLFTGKVSTY